MSADLQSVMIGATDLLFTLLALTVIDRLGRTTLLMVGSVGMVIALAARSTGLPFVLFALAMVVQWFVVLWLPTIRKNTTHSRRSWPGTAHRECDFPHFHRLLFTIW